MPIFLTKTKPTKRLGTSPPVSSLYYAEDLPIFLVRCLHERYFEQVLLTLGQSSLSFANSRFAHGSIVPQSVNNY